MKMRICLVLLSLCICAGRGVAQGHASPADLVVLHGKIYTVNAKQPWAQALAIRGGQIIAVGSDKQMESYRGASTQVIDAKGHLVLLLTRTSISSVAPSACSTSSWTMPTAFLRFRNE